MITTGVNFCVLSVATSNSIPARSLDELACANQFAPPCTGKLPLWPPSSMRFAIFAASPRVLSGPNVVLVDASLVLEKIGSQGLSYKYLLNKCILFT